jgi:hypothetical protein
MAWNGITVMAAVERNTDMGTNEYFVWKQGGVGQRELLFAVNASDQLMSVVSTDGTDQVTNTITSTTVPLNTPIVAGLYVAGGQIMTFFNNVEAIAGAASGVFNGSNAMSIFSINAAGGFAGKISEMLIYKRSLSAGERSAVKSYLQGKWGIL